MASLICNWKLVEAKSIVLKISFEQRERQFSITIIIMSAIFSLLFLNRV